MLPFFAYEGYLGPGPALADPSTTRTGGRARLLRPPVPMIICDPEACEWHQSQCSAYNTLYEVTDAARQRPGVAAART